MLTWQRTVNNDKRESAMTAGLNLQAAGFTRQDRSALMMDSGLRLSDRADAETRSGDCHRQARDIDSVLFDDNPDGNAFDVYVGVASAIGLLLVLIVAVITAVSLWLLIQR
jgi:hypothetical protein